MDGVERASDVTNARCRPSIRPGVSGPLIFLGGARATLELGEVISRREVSVLDPGVKRGMEIAAGTLRPSI